LAQILGVFGVVKSLRNMMVNAKGEMSMKISARNVFKGKVKQITEGVVNSEVIIELPGGVEVVSIITKHSAEALELAVGKEVYAVIKASDVMIGDPHPLRD
jgi:molybdopterin-binding protein